MKSLIKYSLPIILLLSAAQISEAQVLVPADEPDATENALFGWDAATFGNLSVISAPQKDMGSLKAVGSISIYTGSLENRRRLYTEISPDGLPAFSNFGISVDVNTSGEIAVGSLGDNNGALFSGTVFMYQFTDTAYTLTGKLASTDLKMGDRFGYSLDFHDEQSDLLVVGAYQADGMETKSGAAYLFEKKENGWMQMQKLIANDGNSNDYFGHSVHFVTPGILAISAYNADGAAERSGAVYIFERNAENEWVQTAKISDSSGNSSDLFGYVLNSGSHYNLWSVVKTSIPPTTDFTGHLFVGAPGTNHENGQTGSVYLYYKNSEGSWTQRSEIVEENAAHNDHFGISIAHFEDQGLLFVGANRAGETAEGTVYSYSYYYNNWDPEDNSFELWNEPYLAIEDGEPLEYFGSRLNASENTLIVSSPYKRDNGKVNAGAAYFFELLAVSNEENLDEVIEYKLEQNYPNPFNPSTTIKYQVKDPGQVTLTVFNLLGQKVRTLVNEFQTTGSYTATFDAFDLSSGFYFYRLEVNDFVSTKKMMLIK
jgi:hypothetical protein